MTRKDDSSNVAMGFGVALLVILLALLIWGVYYAYMEVNRTAPEAETQADEAFSIAMKGRADFINTDGGKIGEARLQEGANGVLIRVEAANLPPGGHAIHIHKSGNCTPLEETGAGGQPANTFENAGPHLAAASNEHGLMNEEGPHAGDLPNIFVAEDGTLHAHLFADRVTLGEGGGGELARIFDADGAAIVIHSGTDDYETPPTGMAGDRIACAAIERG